MTFGEKTADSETLFVGGWRSLRLSRPTEGATS